MSKPLRSLETPFSFLFFFSSSRFFIIICVQTSTRKGTLVAKMAEEDEISSGNNYEDFLEYPTPLRLVQRNRREEFIRMVESSTDRKAILNCVHLKSGDTPLIVASRHGHINLLKFLISCGIDIEQRNKDLKRALHEAAAGSHLECTRLLISNNAEVDCLKRADW